MSSIHCRWDLCQYIAAGRVPYKIAHLTKLDFSTFFLSRILNNFSFDLLSQQTNLTGDNVWFMNNLNRSWFSNLLVHWHLHLKPWQLDSVDVVGNI